MTGSNSGTMRPILIWTNLEMWKSGLASGLHDTLEDVHHRGVELRAGAAFELEQRLAPA